MNLNDLLRLGRHGAVAAAVLLVAACGGGGGDPGTNPGQDGGTKPLVAGSIELYPSSTTMKTGSSGAKLTITAIVKDKGNMAIPNIPLTLKTGYGSLSPVTKTDEKGVAVAELTPPKSNNVANRTFDVEAVAKGASQKITVNVEGTTLALSGDNTLAINQAGNFSLEVRDGTSQLVPNAPLQITTEPANAGTIAFKPGFSSTTNASGRVEFSYTPNQSGTHRILVNGLNAPSSQLAVNVGSSVFQFQSGATFAWPLRRANEVSVRVADSTGASVPAGTPVRLSLTRGCLASFVPANSTLTACAGQLSQLDVSADAAGVVKAYAISTDAGPVMVKAENLSAGGSGSANGHFAATTPAMILLQANPNSIQPSTSNTNNAAQIEAAVLDDNNNPVAGVPVYFTVENDVSGGQLATPSVVTDQNGRAVNTYRAGPRGTGADGVKVIASVAPPWQHLSSSTIVTVGGDGLTIAIGASNKVTIVNADTKYNRIYTVFVTNSASRAVSSLPVTVRAIPTHYSEGVMCWYEAAKSWVPKRGFSKNDDTGLPAGHEEDGIHPNEDTNLNGNRDPGEPNLVTEPNNLKPGFVATLVPAQADGTVVEGQTGSSVLNLTTDANGFAYFAMQWAKDYQSWAKMKVVANARVGGSESRNETPALWLGAAAPDMTEKTATPPGATSPYGDGSHNREFIDHLYVDPAPLVPAKRITCSN